jgi:integrase
MPKVNLSQDYVAKIPKLFGKNPISRITLTDTKAQGLVVNIEKSGNIYYEHRHFDADGKQIMTRIGPTNLISLKDAREAALRLQFEGTEGNYVGIKQKRGKKVLTLKEIYDEFEKSKFPTGDQHPKKSDDLVLFRRARTNRLRLNALRSNFGQYFDYPYHVVDKLLITRWGEAKLAEDPNRRPCTINKEINSLRGMLRWAKDIGLVDDYMFDHFRLFRDPIEHNHRGRRCLTTDETDRLMKTLVEREQIRRAKNKRFAESYAPRYREHPVQLYPPLGQGFTDEVMPMILLSLHTGARKGSVLGLRWRDVKFDERMIYYQAEMSKAGNTIPVPMNDVVVDTLMQWRNQHNITDSDKDQSRFVFTGRDGISPLDNSSPSCWSKILKKAEIKNFRWHDMRHTFASTLAKDGIDVVTLCSLMGHSDIKTTSIYLHPDIEKKQKAVNILQSVFVRLPEKSAENKNTSAALQQ